MTTTLALVAGAVGLWLLARWYLGSDALSDEWIADQRRTEIERSALFPESPCGKWPLDR